MRNKGNAPDLLRMHPWITLPVFNWGILLLLAVGIRVWCSGLAIRPIWGMVGAGMMLSALLWLLYCILSFRRYRTSPDPRVRPQHLITDGPFGISRNPIYLGLAFFMLGAGIALHHAIFLVTMSLFILLVQRINIIPEERLLESAYGQEYLAYKRRVRRWL